MIYPFYGVYKIKSKTSDTLVIDLTMTEISFRINLLIKLHSTFGPNHFIKQLYMRFVIEEKVNKIRIA